MAWSRLKNFSYFLALEKLRTQHVFVVSVTCEAVNNCSKHGSCIEVNTCDCDSGFKGSLDCSTGLFPTSVCSVLLSLPLFCKIISLHHVLPLLSLYSHFSTVITVSCEEVNSCSGRGNCTGPNVCTCEDGYKSVGCSQGNWHFIFLISEKFINTNFD